MTPEEACEYLGISLDEELDINTIERNYKAKLSECGDNAEQRAKIEEACNALIEVYDELYGKSEDNTVVKKHEGLLMKLAVLMAGVFLLASAGVMYFVYKIHTESKPSVSEAVSSAEYERLRRELEVLRQKQEETPTLQNTPSDYTALVERAMPSMLLIRTNRGFGSGFFVSSNGDIFTNYHVISNVEYATVQTQDGRNLAAMVKDYDADRDMALLKVDTSAAVPFLTLSSNLPKQGEAVIAIGHPKGYGGTVSNGIVSALRQDDNNTWVQFTAPVSSGSSGGALLNLNGEVVGMPTWIRVDTDSQNLNFAVAPTVLSQFLSQAINKPVRAFAQSTQPKTASNPQPQPTLKTPQTQPRTNIPGAKFVRKDDKYEMYIDVDTIEYNRFTHIASFISLWWPTEKAKAEMRRDPHFVIMPGQDLGVCLLLYTVDFSDNTYVHLRTVNLCTDGSVARDYPRPPDEIRWRTAKKGSRIESLMKEVKRQLRIR